MNPASAASPLFLSPYPHSFAGPWPLSSARFSSLFARTSPFRCGSPPCLSLCKPLPCSSSACSCRRPYPPRPSFSISSRRNRSPRFQPVRPGRLPPSPRTHRGYLLSWPFAAALTGLLRSRFSSADSRPLCSPQPPAACSSCSAELPGSESSPTSPPQPSSRWPSCRFCPAIS